MNNLRIKNTLTGQESDLPVNGLFYAIGARAEFDLLSSMYSSHLTLLQAMNQLRHSSVINCRQTEMDISLPFREQHRHPYGVYSPLATFKTNGIAKLSRARAAVAWPR